MPIRYNISPQLHMVIYICRGLITVDEIFESADRVFHDQRSTPGLTTILDLLSAVENIHLNDIYEIIKRIEKYAEKGLALGPIVILSRSNGIHLFVDTLKLLPSKVPLKINAYHTIEDAIVSLGLSELQEAVIQFWKESISFYENS